MIPPYVNRPERIGRALVCPDCGDRVDQHQERPGATLNAGCSLCPCAVERGVFAVQEIDHIESVRAALYAEALEGLSSQPSPARLGGRTLPPAPLAITPAAATAPAEPDEGEDGVSYNAPLAYDLSDGRDPPEA